MDIIQYGLIGLGTGALYAIVAQGLVLVYRGSGLVNFAQGAFVLVGAYAYYELRESVGIPSVLSALGSVIITGVVGALVQLLILRPMRSSSSLARVIATLGVLVTLQSVAVLIYGHEVRSVHSILPVRSIEVLPGATVGLDRLLILIIGGIVAAVLWVVYRVTAFGRATSAVAENQLVAASLGKSPERIATINWALGAALGAVAGILISPITFLQPTQLPLILMPALAAALVSSFASFPMAFGAGLAIGALESLVGHYANGQGWTRAVPFALVVVVLAIRGKGLPLRSFVSDRLPAIGSGHLRVLPALAILVALGYFLLFSSDYAWANSISVTLVMAIVCLSVVVISGFAGQLSLAQFVLGGVGALVAAKLSSSWHWPFLASIAGAIVVTIVVGAILGLPALRARGMNLGIATLGLAIVGYDLVLNDARYNGGISGISVDSPNLFGWSVDPLVNPGRYAFVVLASLALVIVAVANVRRGHSGRRLLAVRSNERAAAALGVGVYGAKLYGFMLAGGIAALGGCLYAFLQPAVLTGQFDVFSSINIVAVTVVGGVGTLGGALLGAVLIPGGVVSKVLDSFDITKWLPLVGGLSVLAVLRTGQDGLFWIYRDQVRRGTRALARDKPGQSIDDGEPRQSPPLVRDVTPSATTPKRVAPQVLSVRSASVRFGGVAAVTDMSIEILPGQVHGVIGPNGAGKTTLIDAITGLARLATGSVALGGQDITRWSTRRRAQAGLARSFQSIELFASLTIRENLAVGCDSGARRKYLTDLVRPGKIMLSDAALAAVEEFGLADELDRHPEGLSFGRRRVAAIARAIASRPSVLLLDEPAAGLSALEAGELSHLIRSVADQWGIGVLLVEHNIDMVISTSDTVTVMDAGSCLRSGEPNEVRNDRAVVAAYLGVAEHDHSAVLSVPDRA